MRFTELREFLEHKQELVHIERKVDPLHEVAAYIRKTLRGMPLRLVAVTSQQPVWGLVVRKEITKVTDLKGKKLVS